MTLLLLVCATKSCILCRLSCPSSPFQSEVFKWIKDRWRMVKIIIFLFFPKLCSSSYELETTGTQNLPLARKKRETDSLLLPFTWLPPWLCWRTWCAWISSMSTSLMCLSALKVKQGMVDLMCLKSGKLNCNCCLFVTLWLLVLLAPFQYYQ